MTTPLKRSNVRYGILLFLFLATVFNYADRATLSVVAPIMSKELGFDPEAMGLAFSVFGISYVIMQIPGGWLLDKYGSRLVYGCALIGWSVVTMFQGTIYLFASPLIVLVILRLMMGAIEAPAFPANSRLSVQWFPNKERGFVTSVYQAAQYISLGIITPLMTIILHNLSWHYVFYYIGAIGVVLGIFWLVKVRDPSHHPKINQQELDYIRDGGGEPELGTKKTQQKLTLAQIKSVCVNRMMIGVYIGQFCVTSITWFFLTWFPTYLYQAKGMSILKVRAERHITQGDAGNCRWGVQYVRQPGEYYHAAGYRRDPREYSLLRLRHPVRRFHGRTGPVLLPVYRRAAGSLNADPARRLI